MTPTAAITAFIIVTSKHSDGKPPDKKVATLQQAAASCKGRGAGFQ
jgi:hypothetical protein